MTAADDQIEHRQNQFHTWGVYGLLAVSAVLSVASHELMVPAEWYAGGALIVAAVLLQLWHGPRRGRRTPSPRGTVYYVLRWAISFVLTWLNPFFGFYASTGYFDSDELIAGRRRQWLGLLATVVVVAGSQSGGMPIEGPVQWLLFGVLLAANFGLLTVVGRISRQEEQRSRERAVTITALERTNTALQQALDENAALHAQLLLQAREAGVADERRRLAAEIHDTIAQGLTGIIAQLQVVANASDLATARTHLERASDLARHSLGEARRSVHNLAPVALADAGLPEALKKTVTEWGERTGVRAEFTVTGTTEQLHEEVAATLLRIVQEALSNISRHAAARRVGVTLSFLGDEVILDIRDDGSGFDPLAVPARSGTGGFGLPGMCARAERIAGSLTVESEPGHGTAVSARVPLVRHD
ncbi:MULTISPECIES: sensor histidine kinase [unclassified Streptomyces]|uniref:sensor histidine kinase n=1 Tax=unclassified Streptomyces TaxID=2593676 RepID=UPI000BE3CCF0|nr:MULTISPECIES: sensor histidine kinase [unclassified Streptomyces]